MKTNRKRVQVTTAIDLKKSQIIEIKRELERILKSDAFLIKVVCNPDILGGLVIRVNSRVIDFSLAGKLERINNYLSHA